MNKTFKITLIALFSFLTLQLSAQSPKISIQSTLKSITGEAVEDGLRTITFKLYHELEGGVVVWEETADVEVISGIYSHRLGSVTPLNPSHFGSILYLGVVVDNRELSPRTEMTYAPYALSVASIAANGESASFSNDTLIISSKLKVEGNLVTDAGLITGDITCLGQLYGDHGYILNDLGVIGNIGVGNDTPSISLAIEDSDSGITGSEGIVNLVTDNHETLTAKIDGTQGRIGINNPDPQVPLHVIGNNQDGTGTDGTQGSYIHVSTAVHLVTIPNLQGTVAYFEGTTIASGGVVAGQGVTQWSDNRIKKILKRSNGAKDLALLKKIEITDYEYIDKLHFGNKAHKKLIAQQVQEVLPNAVTKMRSVTPSVYELADELEYANNELSITTIEAHEFKKGDKIDLKTSVGDMHDIEVTGVLNAHTFTVNSDKNPEKVFVYGKYVDDFLAVDYDAVSMLNVSASQEMYRMIIDLQKANENLIKENENLSNANASIEDRLSKIESLLAKSEHRLEESIPSEEK